MKPQVATTGPAADPSSPLEQLDQIVNLLADPPGRQSVQAASPNTPGMTTAVPQRKAAMSRSAADTATIRIVPTSPVRTSEVQSLRVRVEANERLLLTVAEAAQRLGIGRSLLYELLADGQVESIHVGRLRRIPSDALVTYVEHQRTPSPRNR